MAANFDRGQIIKTWEVFRQPGEVLEMRIPKAGRYKTISGYFDDPARLADAVIGLKDENFAGIYFTINPVKPDLLARAANRYVKYAETTTSDADIIVLHWLPVDLDAKRPAGISATDAEHEAATTKAREIRRWLIEEQSWPAGAFVLADSGNGCHLNIKIDMSNLPENVAIVKDCLEALDFLFSDDVIQVDTTSQNPARIWKLYGTMARKGDSTAERPHRLTRLIEVPENMGTVSRGQLTVLAAMLPKPEEQPKTNGKGFDPAAYCQAHGLQVHHTKAYKGGTLAVLEECIFNPDHKLTACIIGWPNGARAYRCRHNSCLGKHWEDAKAILEPEEQHPNETEAERIHRLHAEANPPLTRERCDMIEAKTGIHIYNAEDDPKPNEISEEELNAYSISEGPKFECNLPADHFIQRFMAYGSDISDAYVEYWFAGGLFALAVAADKKIKVSLKQGTIYPNLYVSINGKSSLARKSTVVDKSEAMLCQVLPGMLSALVPTEFSPEAFTEHLSDHNHAPWVRDEAAGVLSLMKRDYMRGFKDSLMQLFDCKPFYRKLRTSQRKGTKTEFRVDDPYLNLLWATTDASLGANTEQNDTLSGFMARFLFFFPQGKKTKWLPLEEGTAANSIFEGVVRDQLVAIAAKMAELPECTAMHFSPGAARYYTEWQRDRENEWTASNDGNAMQIYSRLAPTVTKLGMLFELGSPDFDITRPVRLEFIQEACQLVDSYFMPTARAVYDLVGANAEKNVIDRIIAYLKKHNGNASRREILKDVKIKSADFNEYLSTMIESEMVESKTVKRGGKGRDSVYVFLRNVSKVAYVAKVANVANVEEIHSDDKEGNKETLATLETKAILPTVATEGKDIQFATGSHPRRSEPTPSKPKEDPGLQKFKAGMKKRTCLQCGEHFSYDLGIHWQGGYICARCHREGPPNVAIDPQKADAQVKLSEVA